MKLNYNILFIFTKFCKYKHIKSYLIFFLKLNLFIFLFFFYNMLLKKIHTFCDFFFGGAPDTCKGPKSVEALKAPHAVESIDVMGIARNGSLLGPLWTTPVGQGSYRVHHSGGPSPDP